MTPLVESFYEPGTGSWTYLVADPGSGAACVIDPVRAYDPGTGCTDESLAESVVAAAGERDWSIHWVLETHAHADRLSAGDWLRSRLEAPLCIGAGIREVQANFARIYHLPDFATDGRQFDRLLALGDTLPLGDTVIDVFETPGHTADSLSYRVGDAVFVGDTLFAPGYGTARCDFPGGDAGLLWDSIQALHALPAETRLFLCHDYPEPGDTPRSTVTVSESRSENIHVAGGVTRDAFIAMRQARDATLDLPGLIFPALQVNMRGGAAPAPEANGARYLKIPFNTTIAKLLGAKS